MIYLSDKKIAVIGIDHGYGNIKTANTITPTGITEYDSEPIFTGNILECDGKYYRIGEGHKKFIVNKSMDEDFYLFTLMGIACELKRAGMSEADVYIGAGLPLTWVRKQRDSFKEYLCAGCPYAEFFQSDWKKTSIGNGRKLPTRLAEIFQSRWKKTSRK